MMRTSIVRRLLPAVLGLVVCTAPAAAQMAGENLLGDMGTRSGTQAAPGLYTSLLYYRYHTGTIRNGNGDRITIDPDGAGSQTIHALAPVVTWVTPWKVLGANYGMMAVLPFANGSVELPGLEVSEPVSWGMSDLYVVPVQLGWHTPRADILAGLGFFAPTGRYEAGASDNLGKGMWSWEASLGGTLYLDRARTLSIATTAFYEIHTDKEGEVEVGSATLQDAKVGDLLTLEGGVAKTFAHGAGSIGVAYYAQWKVTDDDFGADLPPVFAVEKHRVFGVGPDVTLPIAFRSRLVALVNARWLWETGARSHTEGNALVITATFPVPSIRIGPEGNH